jgi:hypothetical protein
MEVTLADDEPSVGGQQGPSTALGRAFPHDPHCRCRTVASVPQARQAASSPSQTLQA